MMEMHQVQVYNATTRQEIDVAFAVLVRERPDRASIRCRLECALFFVVSIRVCVRGSGMVFRTVSAIAVLLICFGASGGETLAQYYPPARAYPPPQTYPPQ